MESDFVNIANALTKLAILKSTKKEENEIAIMAKFLLSDLRAEDILRCCGYFAKRNPKFPDPSDFFNLIVPSKTLEEYAEEEIGGLLELIRRGGYGANLFSEIQKDLLEKWSWSSLSTMKQADLDKARVNMLFYLKNKLSSDGKTREMLSKEAFENYHNGKNNLLLQGELGNGIEKSM